MVDINADKTLLFNEGEKMWERLTKRMFKHYPAWLVYEKLGDIYAQVSDEYYSKKYPIFDGITTQIIDIADYFGLKPIGKNIRICPFHADKNPSLSLSNEKSCFHCFGCGEKGGIIKFYAMLKRLNDGHIKEGISTSKE